MRSGIFLSCWPQPLTSLPSWVGQFNSDLGDRKKVALAAFFYSFKTMYNGGMRPIEILIVLVPGLYLIWPQPRPLAIRILPAVTGILIFVHLAVEGYRWQMIPLYFLTALLAIFSLF